MAATATKVSIRPLHDRVIVQRLEEGEQKVGGIIIPDTAKEKPQQGKVIAVGKGKVEKDGKEYLIMREEEILGVITK
jgi:co-chaperonin GroES (HSP10)